MTNQLATETSPYLLQHKDNPVDWYPWGQRALERASSEDKPILLSIGYAACHWCHVMERESFEDEDTAELMNAHFICIKVDREERPDLDSIYMDAVQAMTGQGGWPMTVFLTPDGKPFYGGTYFPPEDRQGMPGFKRILEAVADAWRSRRDEVEQQGGKLVDHIRSAASVPSSDTALSEDLLPAAVAPLERAFDDRWGGFGPAPKFPQPMTIDFLMRMERRGHHRAGEMARLTLDRMASQGMFDQIGGGFHRYSVDRYWLVPHFEKMLYDNALLLGTYARAWQAWRRERYRAVAEATAGWMLREMRDPTGAFWSSLDADSEGEEGKFYVWTLDEVRDACGDEADAAIAHFGFTRQGNFEGTNIPIVASDAEPTQAIERARRALFERRAQRVRPATDEKALAAWNGLAAAALAEAGSILARPEWVEAAAAAMRFVVDHMTVDGRLFRSFRSGRLNQPGVCEDYAAVLSGCLALYEASFDQTWLDHARWAADEALRLFSDEDNGGFYSTGSDAERLVVRPKDLYDNAVPSPNSTLALELQKLATLTGHKPYEEAAVSAMGLLQGVVTRAPQAFGHMLCAMELYLGRIAEVVIVGDPASDDTATLLRAVREVYAPNKIVAVGQPEQDGDTEIPLMQGRRRIHDRATAYLCFEGTCLAPTTDAAQLREQLLSA